jgi:regulator of cell morphogenesis and NO signaling
MQSIAHTPIGDIARTTPSSTRVFLRHRLDFCCGGRRTLAQACERAGLDPVAIAEELEQEAKRGPAEGWADRSQTELADFIESHYHAALRRDFPPLIEAARKVERVHAEKRGVPAGLAAVLSDFYTEMEQHMAKEERVLFPMIRSGARGERMYMPVTALESEHEEHRTRLERIRALTDNLHLPETACATWTALYHGLETMEAELMQHIHLENNILFERAVR